MISYLAGKILNKNDNCLVIEAGGVGYKVFTTSAVVAGSEIGAGVELWTHLAVRENSLDLYGFALPEELNFFELLITISGIGPKSALGIMNLTEISTLKQAIRSGDASHLTKVSGIGQKNAQKIVLELKEKLGEITEEETPFEQNEAFDALTALGYSLQEARMALRELPAEKMTTAEQIKAALRNLS